MFMTAIKGKEVASTQHLNLTCDPSMFYNRVLVFHTAVMKSVYQCWEET